MVEIEETFRVKVESLIGPLRPLMEERGYAMEAKYRRDKYVDAEISRVEKRTFWRDKKETLAKIKGDTWGSAQITVYSEELFDDMVSFAESWEKRFEDDGGEAKVTKDYGW